MNLTKFFIILFLFLFSLYFFYKIKIQTSLKERPVPTEFKEKKLDVKNLRISEKNT